MTNSGVSKDYPPCEEPRIIEDHLKLRPIPISVHPATNYTDARFDIPSALDGASRDIFRTVAVQQTLNGR